MRFRVWESEKGGFERVMSGEVEALSSTDTHFSLLISGTGLYLCVK